MDINEVGYKSSEIISRKGYVFWRCQTLNGDAIAVIKEGGFYKDRATDAAKDLIKSNKLLELPTIYTLTELAILCEAENFIVLHEAKKMGASLSEGEFKMV